MTKECEEKQLVEHYEILRKRMRIRVEELSKSYEHSEPLNQLYALLYCDPELEQLDQKLCELETLLPDAYQTGGPL